MKFMKIQWKFHRKYMYFTQQTLKLRIQAETETCVQRNVNI